MFILWYLLYYFVYVELVLSLTLFILFVSPGILQKWGRSEQLLAFPWISWQQRLTDCRKLSQNWVSYLFICMLVQYSIEGHLVSECFSLSLTNDPITVAWAVRRRFVVMFGETHSLCQSLVIRKKPLLTG